MALHNDTDPLPKRQGVIKIKKLLQKTLKIKPKLDIDLFKLAKAVFLLVVHIKNNIIYHFKKISALYHISKNSFRINNTFLPHYCVAMLAIIVLASNLIVKYARADYSVTFTDPANEIRIAGSADIFTPIINNDGMQADRAYKNSSEDFAFVGDTVDTVITQREEPLPDNSQNTVSYVVRNGDNLTTLGWKFNVKLSTLMYLNDIENANLVKPGQKIKIPPKGYEVSASAIAKKEQEKLAKANRNTVIRSTSSSRNSTSGSGSVNYAAGSSKNGYPYGYCTYFVATKRFVPSNWGNAKNWLNSAKRAGYSTGNQPAVGSIGVTPESWWGHVVFVESVNGNMVTFSEMNAVGWGKVSRRTLPVSSFRGFIY